MESGAASRTVVDLALEEAYALALEGRIADAMQVLEAAEAADGADDRLALARARCLLSGGGAGTERGRSLLEALALRPGPSQAQGLLSLVRRRESTGDAADVASLIGPVVTALRQSGLGEDCRPLSALLTLEARHIERAQSVDPAPAGNGSRPPRVGQPRRSRSSYGEIIGRSPAMQDVYDRLDRIIPATEPVIVQGETGTGKELVARLIHDRGPRRHCDFVVVNCAGMPEGLLESELFGHERGAFTGADRARPGLFELAHGGTLLLDEIADMPSRMQGDLLRALQSGEVRRLGGREPFHVDVRVIAASNRDLEQEVERGDFRADLYYRLHVLKLDLPPLRERLEDVPLLVERLLPALARGRDLPGFTERAMARLTAYPWPGNVRQLQNVLRRLTVAGIEVVDETDLPGELRRADAPVCAGTLRQLEERAIRQAVTQTAGNKSRAARLLGVNRKTLYLKLRRMGLQ